MKESLEQHHNPLDSHIIINTDSTHGFIHIKPEHSSHAYQYRVSNFYFLFPKSYSCKNRLKGGLEYELNQLLNVDELTLKSDVINTNSTANTGHLIFEMHDTNVHGSYSVTSLDQILLIFEWYVVRGGCKNGHQKGIKCLKEIGL